MENIYFKIRRSESITIYKGNFRTLFKIPILPFKYNNLLNF